MEIFWTVVGDVLTAYSEPHIKKEKKKSCGSNLLSTASTCINRVLLHSQEAAKVSDSKIV
jgi:hypothetical protein